jgi:hypothetical protein
VRSYQGTGRVPNVRRVPGDVGNTQILYPGMTRLTESSLLNIKNKSFQITAQLVVLDGGAEGTIIAEGGSFGGWG